MMSGREPPPRKHFLYVGPAVAYVAAVFVGGSLPARVLRVPPVPGVDKVMHLVAFAGMFVVIFRALDHELYRLKPAHNVGIGVALTCALGGLLEIHQLGIPGRSAELLDFVADAIGALLAAWLLWRLLSRSGRRASSGG